MRIQPLVDRWMLFLPARRAPDIQQQNTMPRPHWIDKHFGNSKSRFIVVGLWNTAFGYLAFLAFFFAFSDYLHYLVVAVISHATAVTQAFILHRHFVFQSRDSWKSQFVRYNIGVTGIFLLGLVGLSILVGQLRFSPPVAQAAVTAVSIVVSFLVHRDYSFRKSE